MARWMRSIRLFEIEEGGASGGERNKEAPIQVADPRILRQLPGVAPATAAPLFRDSSIIRG